ncbi:MAG: hypothetical protein V1792_20380 [Pseudomonadota bacterium]
MSTRDMHDKAMEKASKADLARIMGDAESADSFLREAYLLERRAAESLKDRLDLEPTRSVLFRSAASLALDCGELREAERLAVMGLSGNAPDEIADELRGVFERATLDRHLDLHGYQLTYENKKFVPTDIREADE